MEKTKRILVIEDEPGTQKAIQDELAADGFETLGASDGETGLAMALKEKPDVVLIDILLPGMNGMDVLKKLREDAWGRRVPAILLTSLEANDKIMHGVVEDEPSYYLVKSRTSLQEVSDRVKKCLGLDTTP